MRHVDLFIISEAQRKAEAFEHEVERIHLLAQLPDKKGWRHRTAQILLQLATRLEPQHEVQQTTNPC